MLQFIRFYQTNSIKLLFKIYQIKLMDSPCFCCMITFFFFCFSYSFHFVSECLSATVHSMMLFRNFQWNKHSHVFIDVCYSDHRFCDARFWNSKFWNSMKNFKEVSLFPSGSPSLFYLYQWFRQEFLKKYSFEIEVTCS